jgi:hypothetical protein
MKVQAAAQSAVAVFAIAAFACAGGTAAAAEKPIGPQQHFVGLVNGHKTGVVVDTVCPGPANKRTGRVASGQTMAVAQAAHGHGDTGLFSHVYSWFQPARGKKPVTLTFRKYGKPQGIPSSVRVPCNGKGKAVFSSCPYLAPCAAGFIPDTLSVTFENIATTSSGRAVQRPGALALKSSVRAGARPITDP